MIYNSGGMIASAVLPDGGVLSYGYDSNGNLSKVIYPDGGYRQYVYNESALTSGGNFLNALTGDVDEAGTRFTSIGYDAQGRAVMSTLPGGVDVTRIVYGGTSSVTYPTGAQATLGFVVTNGSVHASTVSAPCGVDCGQPNAAATFDSNGYVASTTDFNGNVTTMVHDANGLLDQQVDGSGSTEQRTTNTTWNTALRVPLTRTVLDVSGNTVAKTSWVYNTIGQPLARCEIDPAIVAAASYTCVATGTVPAGVRRWTYTYCDTVDSTQCPLVGLLLSVTGPRTDLTQTTTYSYYTDSVATGCGTPGGACHQPGDLYQVTDPLGHVTTIDAYDADGRITRYTDANGAHTDLTYTPRGWLASRSLDGATTRFGYTPYGAVASVTDPDGVATGFTYDAAHRLTDITDAQGNRIHYTLDAAGDKTQEQVYSAAGTVVRSLSRSYNTLGQLTAVVDGLNQTVFSAGYADSYDGNGNLVHSADALGIQRRQGFDALNRLQSTIANYNGTDPATTNTQTAFDHDALDRLDGVADPDGLDTVYTYDGLGNRTQRQSPDTGTSTDTYDAAGNRLTHTDAKGVVSTSTYDALDRLTGTGYVDSTLDVRYAYDEPDTVTGCSGSSPIGRLTRVVEASVSTVYCYDNRGNVIEKQQVATTQTDVTQYAYTAAGRLSRESTPDHTVIAYAYDSDGRISGVQATPSGATTAPPTVVGAITYRPFGPISRYTLGNGQTVTRTYDANDRLTDLTSPALNLHFARDAAGDITALGNAPGANPATETYGYDPLYRLSGISDAGSALESYTYDRTGDRLSKTAAGLATGPYAYTPGTHQLASIGNAARSNDADGNTTASVVGAETFGFSYNGRNRLAAAQRNGQTVATYTYNALGQRLGKEATLPQHLTERYAYDEAGRLIGEYGTLFSGKHPRKKPSKKDIAISRTYVWLGSLPVAVIDNTINGSATDSTVNYVTADPLGTPRAVTDGTGALIWSWAYQGNPFGEQLPTSATGYVLNLRYPGQYFDAETGLMQNGARDYDSASGRFGQADPTGLNGGINPYVYGLNSPLSYIDPSGLQAQTVPAPAPAPSLPPAPNTGPVPNTGVPANDPEFDPEAGPGTVIEACVANPVVCGAVLTVYPTDAGGPQDEAPPDSVNPVVLFPKTRRHIPNQCPVDEDGKEDRCAALYRSSLATCASLTGKKKFMCMAAARKNYEQCMEEE
ncbi:MAG: RHS repeat protein [Xanthomonadaceae bacterium]|nr:RHS repeat protein [Xanthomonadaceae bacterium]